MSDGDADDEIKVDDSDTDTDLDDNMDFLGVIPDQTVHLRDYGDLWGQDVSIGCEDINKENFVRKNIIRHFDLRDANNVSRGKHHSNQGYTEWEAAEGIEYLTEDSGAEIDTSLNNATGLVDSGSSDPGGPGEFNQNPDTVNLNWVRKRVLIPPDNYIPTPYGDARAEEERRLGIVAQPTEATIGAESVLDVLAAMVQQPQGGAQAVAPESAQAPEQPGQDQEDQAPGQGNEEGEGEQLSDTNSEQGNDDESKSEDYQLKAICEEIFEDIVDKIFGKTPEKSKDPMKDDNDGDNDILTTNPNSNHVTNSRKLRFLTLNIRGIQSKVETLSAILSKFSIDVCCLSETLCTDDSAVKITNFRTFFRNRISRKGGGVMILIREEIAESAVRVAQGKDAEFISVKLNQYQPPIVITQYYGSTPRAGVGFPELSEEIFELFSVIRKYQRQGVLSLVTGDINAWTGRDMIRNNHFSVNKEGILWKELVRESDMVFVNDRLSNPITFVDKRTGRGRTLDVVVTDKPEKIEEIRVDTDEGEMTPYTPYLNRDGSERRVYSDHRPVFFTCEAKVKEAKKKSAQIAKPKVVWRMKAPFGHIKYDILTDRRAEELMVMTRDMVSVNALLGRFLKVIEESKRLSYGRMTVSKTREISTEARDVWEKRVKEVEKLYKEVENQEVMKQMWTLRDNVLRSGKCPQMVSVMREDTGEMVEDKDDIMEYLLQYNVSNMSKEEVSDEIEDLNENKRTWIKLILEHRDDIPRVISWDDYMRTVRKIFHQNKGVFQDFIKSGAKFKVAVFSLLNRIYAEEIIPEEMKKTTLTQIPKKKGDPSRVKNSRFIHGKGWPGKLLEKTVVMMTEKSIKDATPEAQAGGQESRSCRDHLLKLTMLMRHYKKIGKPLPILAVDVRACFDRVKLSDLVFDCLEAGANAKDIMIINEATKATLIRIAGDDQERGIIVLETAGQGTVFAPLATSLSLGKSLHQHFEDFVEMARLGRIRVPSFGFIDDILINSNGEEGMREAAVRVSRTLDVLSLKSNANKTALIIIGNNEAARKMRENFVKKPLIVQDHEVKVSEEEPYLGFKISQKGLVESVDRSIQTRVGRAWARVLEIKRLANHIKLRKVGWFKVCIALINSQIISALCYGVEAWVSPLVRQTEYLELSYKKIMYKILQVQKTLNYNGVLFETGLPCIRDVINKLRVTYINDVLGGRVQDNLLREMLKEDHVVFKEKSVLSEISNVCTNLNIPDVTSEVRGKKTMKAVLKQTASLRVWGAVMRSRVMQPSTSMKSQAKWYHSWTRTEARAQLFLRLGSLRFKSNWAGHYKKRGESVSCPSDLCGTEVDSLAHAKVCPFMETKWNARKMQNPREVSKYLMRLNIERIRRWRMPLW